MVTSLETARQFQDLMNLGSHDMPYFFDKIFSAKGWRERSLSKRKFKLLKGIDKQIRAMLNEGEKVYFLSSGIESSFAESFLLGWVMYYINRMAIIFTTQRILLLQIGTRDKLLHLKFQIRYPAITQSSRSFFGNCKIKFRSGKTSVFDRVPKSDNKFIQQVIDHLRGNVSSSVSDAVGKENLCPYCYVKIEEFPQTCPQCQKGFKSANKAGWLSLIFPGLGDFYIGHRLFAILEILGASLIWIGLFIPEEEEPANALGLLIGAVILFLFMHGIDALVTRYVGRKGIYPGK